MDQRELSTQSNGPVDTHWGEVQNSGVKYNFVEEHIGEKCIGEKHSSTVERSTSGRSTVGRSTLGRSAMGRSIVQNYIGEEHRSTLVKSTTLWRSTVASVEWNGRINNRWLYKNPTDPTDCQGNSFYRVKFTKGYF